MNVLSLSNYNTLTSICILLPLLDQICIVIICTAIAGLQSTHTHIHTPWIWQMNRSFLKAEFFSCLTAWHPFSTSQNYPSWQVDRSISPPFPAVSPTCRRQHPKCNPALLCIGSCFRWDLHRYAKRTLFLRPK